MRLFFLVACIAGCLYHPLRLSAQDFDNYELYKKVSVPGNDGYDYLFLDTANKRLYISHGTSVNVLDIRSEQLAGAVEGLKGVHGIALVPDLNKGFISDGKGNAVVVFDMASLKVIKTIPITGKDPDAIMYDPYSHRVFTFNGDSQDASVIDAATMTQTGTVPLSGTPEFAVSDGEGKIYNNLEDKSILNMIDAKTLKVTKTYPLAPCDGPTGLALDKTHQRLFTVCRKNKGMTVLDAASGKIITTVPIGAGVDAVVYDGKAGLIFCSNGDGTATVIRQRTPDEYQVVQTIATQWKAKTMAEDPATRKLYFSAFDTEPGNKTRIPNTFKVLIFQPKAR